MRLYSPKLRKKNKRVIQIRWNQLFTFKHSVKPIIGRFSLFIVNEKNTACSLQALGLLTAANYFGGRKRKK